MTIETLKSDYHFNRGELKKMEKVTLCKECEFAERWPGENRLTGLCLNLKAPTTEYVTGSKHCNEINDEGECGFFQPWVGYAGNSNKGVNDEL